MIYRQPGFAYRVNMPEVIKDEFEYVFGTSGMHSESNSSQLHQNWYRKTLKDLSELRREARLNLKNQSKKQSSFSSSLSFQCTVQQLCTSIFTSNRKRHFKTSVTTHWVYKCLTSLEMLKTWSSRWKDSLKHSIHSWNIFLDPNFIHVSCFF